MAKPPSPSGPRPARALELANALPRRGYSSAPAPYFRTIDALITAHEKHQETADV